MFSKFILSFFNKDPLDYVNEMKFVESFWVLFRSMECCSPMVEAFPKASPVSFAMPATMLKLYRR